MCVVGVNMSECACVNMCVCECTVWANGLEHVGMSVDVNVGVKYLSV